MKPVKLILILIIVLLIPLIPFILWNQSIEESVVHWTTTCSNDPLLISGATIGLLTVDLFLPIPSSVLSVFVTRQLSTIISPSWLGMIISILVIWTGMTLGALSAWLVGKFGGEAIARLLREKSSLPRYRKSATDTQPRFWLYYGRFRYFPRRRRWRWPAPGFIFGRSSFVQSP